MIVKQHNSHSRNSPLVLYYGVNLRGAIFIYSSDVVIFEILVQIYMRSKCQVKPIIVIYIEIHRKDDYCLTEPMQFNCEVGEVLAAFCRVA